MATDGMTKTLADFTDAEVRDEYAERFTTEEQLATFSNDEIEREFEDRFDRPLKLNEFDSESLIEELDRRGDMPEAETEITDEIIDLLAEASRTSSHAARAYTLLGLPSLSGRHRLIAGRMSEVTA